MCLEHDITRSDCTNYTHSKSLWQTNIEVLSLEELTSHCLDSQVNHDHEVLISTISQIIWNILDPKLRNNNELPADESHSRRCAVVSTAGYLSKFQNGPRINAADFVIRSGAGPTHGFENLVGSRTDVRILRHSVFSEGRGNPTLSHDERVIVIHDKIESFRSPLQGHMNRDILLSRGVPYMNFHRWRTTEERKSSRLITCMNTSRDLSSGLWAVVLALEVLELCSTVSLFGFLGHLHPESEYHYWTMGLEEELSNTSEVYDRRTSAKGGHLFKREQECYMHLSKEHDVSTDHVILA